MYEAEKLGGPGLPSEDHTNQTQHAGIIENLTSDLQRLNQAVMNAVESGVSVELVRTSRHHCGEGNWGDLIKPVFVKG